MRKQCLYKARERLVAGMDFGDQFFMQIDY